MTVAAVSGEQSPVITRIEEHTLVYITHCHSAQTLQVIQVATVVTHTLDCGCGKATRPRSTRAGKDLSSRPARLQDQIVAVGHLRAGTCSPANGKVASPGASARPISCRRSAGGGRRRGGVPWRIGRCGAARLQQVLGSWGGEERGTVRYCEHFAQAWFTCVAVPCPPLLWRRSVRAATRPGPARPRSAPLRRVFVRDRQKTFFLFSFPPPFASPGTFQLSNPVQRNAAHHRTCKYALIWNSIVYSPHTFSHLDQESVPSLSTAINTIFITEYVHVYRGLPLLNRSLYCNVKQFFFWRWVYHYSNQILITYATLGNYHLTILWSTAYPSDHLSKTTHSKTIFLMGFL